MDKAKNNIMGGLDAILGAGKALGHDVGKALDFALINPLNSMLAHATGNVDTYTAPNQPTPPPRIVNTPKAHQPFVEALKSNAQMFKSAAQYVKQNLGQDLDPYIVPTIYAKESSAGANKSSYNPKIGEYAWQYGLTQDAVSTLNKKGLKTDLSSPQGAANAAAAFYALRQNVYGVDPQGKQVLDAATTSGYQNDPAKAYTERYYGGPKSTQSTVAQQFGSIYNSLKSSDILK